MKLIRFHIQSLAPGMMQNPATPALLESLRTKTPLQIKKDITLEDDARVKVYRSEPTETDKRQKMGVPMQNIMSCMVLAGRLVKSGKKALSTAKDTTIYGFLEFVGEFCPFKNCDANGDVPWKPFPVKGTLHNGASEVAVCINRPRIPHWETYFDVKFDNKRGVDEATLVKLVEVAGRQVGLGDWRPAKRGRFGRFIITKMEVLDMKVEEREIEVVRYEGDLIQNAPADLIELAEV